MLVAGAAVVFRLGREVLDRYVWRRWGGLGVLVVIVAGIAVILAWRGVQRRRARRRGAEFTPEMVVEQLAALDIGGPAFPEDGTLLGASIIVVNQRPRVLEVDTAFEIFGATGQRLGAIEQIEQSRTRQAFRVLTPFDQFFTHHFEIEDAAGSVLLRLSRPRKLFRTKLHVFDGEDRFLGLIHQENVFWKIRFSIRDAGGNQIGEVRAENLRAWDFHVVDAAGQVVATLAKSWEGWGQTAFTRADRYAVRIERPLSEPLRTLTVTAALCVDLALKQDARGFG